MQQDSIQQMPIQVADTVVRDSAVRAVRVHRTDSLAADTLAADTIHATTGATLELMPLSSFSYFADDSLYRAEGSLRSYGYEPTVVPFRLHSESRVAPVMLLAGILLAAAILLRLKGETKNLLRAFFFPIPGKKEDPLTEDPLRWTTRILSVGLLAISAALISFVIILPGIGYFPFPESPYVLMAAFLVLWLTYFVAKRLLVGFVNWIFFRGEKILTYQRAYTLLMCFQSLLFLMLAMVAVCLPFSPQKLLFVVLIALGIGKMLLFFKTYAIFFPKIYGALHLFVYFCTLELLPVLVLWRILTFTDWLGQVII